jgi:hypothetical protein
MNIKKTNDARKRLIDGLSPKAGRFKVLPRAVIQSMPFISMSDQGKLVSLFAWNLLAFDYENNPVNNGIISLSDTYLEALGLQGKDVGGAKKEIVDKGFFDHVKDDFYQLSERWSE